MKKENSKEWSKIIAKCWSDPQFKKRLMDDPEGTLKAEGVAIHEGVHLIILEDTKQTHHLIIPEKPSSELSQEQLENIAAGHHKQTYCLT
jgi:hypothetical protein